MIVLDASVVLELLLHTRAGQVVADRMADPVLTIHAPHIVDLEVAQVLRRVVHAGTISADRGLQALTDLRQLDLERYPHDPLLPRIWALRDNITAYDAAYVALAEVLQAPLLTRDERLAGASGHGARIEIVG